MRKVRNLEDARDQLTAFLTSLFKAVEGAANAALVYTLAIGKDGQATDAYNEENQFHRRQTWRKPRAFPRARLRF